MGSKRPKPRLYGVVKTTEVLDLIHTAEKLLGRNLVPDDGALILENAVLSVYSWLVFRMRDSHVAIPDELQDYYHTLVTYASQ